MTWRGGSGVNAKTYCFWSAKGMRAAASSYTILPCALGTLGATAFTRLRSLKGRCHILITYVLLEYTSVTGLVANPSQVKHPLHPFNINCVVCQVALLEQCFEGLVATFYLPPLYIHILKTIFKREWGGEEEQGCISRGKKKNPPRGNFSRDGIHMHASRSHPSALNH